MHEPSGSPFLFFILFPVMWLAVSFAISQLSGWGLLARRFRAQEPWSGQSWGWQSARFRGWCNYNNCLTVGASPEALYLSIMPLFRIGTPPLLIPWTEIQVQTGKMFFGWYDTAAIRLGNEEQVNMRIYGKLVDRLRQAAGPGWPHYHIEQMNAR